MDMPVGKFFEGVVYCYVCPDGRRYIGLTGYEHRRKRQWLQVNKSYAGAKLEHARRKYHPSLWTYEVLKRIKCRSLPDLYLELALQEKYFISFYNTTDLSCGFNTSGGGEATPAYVMSEADREMLRANSRRARPVVCYHPDGRFIGKFRSGYEAARYFGFPRSSISVCCQRFGGYHHSSHGLLFAYADDLATITEFASGAFMIGYARLRKSVLSFDLAGNLVREYPSIASCASHIGTRASHVKDLCVGKELSYKGLVYCFASDSARRSCLEKGIHSPLLGRTCSKMVTVCNIRTGEYLTAKSMREACRITGSTLMRLRTALYRGRLLFNTYLLFYV